MSKAAQPGVDPGSRAFLEQQGFEGFLLVGQLRHDRCEALPNLPGIYAVVRETIEKPEFMTRSNAAEYRGESPTRPIDELIECWVPRAQILFYGRAFGPGVRSLIKQRVKRYMRFGQGRVVGHWDGRFVWQLRDHSSLRIAWKVIESGDLQAAEDELQLRFSAHYGEPPFANMTRVSDPADPDEEIDE